MAGVYISYPFCHQKCTFCNFASGVMRAAVERDYLSALLVEVEGHRWEWVSETVYLGGGTPSRLDPDDLAAVLERIPGRPWREATIEAAPGTFPHDVPRRWVEAGLDRVSLGVQSFVASEAARTGRKHRAETVASDVEALKSAGIQSINIDLIAGLPGQTSESWRESLDWVERLGPEHVSVYMLEVDEDSRLGREMMLGGVRYGAADAPSDALTVSLYEYSVKRLSELGLFRYEISNFARPGYESAHNLKYWLLEPYVGFGADAHSYDGTKRTQNVESAADYVERWRSGLGFVSSDEPAVRDEERFFVGLRLMSGVRPVADDWVRFGKTIDRCVGDGLLERDGDLVRLTSRGILFSNEVFSQFITV